ncbi:hypothetical protein HPB49_000078 [Dermacentor silvarum]|uniref:Uncharacterized protein n=1 Tax=Dermacentor silvarum TaxID=543639 RepID=A0ACB8DMB6_DERSI|nr:hypothetical protein HPB49_000078 [Dermacentor silvarum]
MLNLAKSAPKNVCTGVIFGVDPAFDSNTVVQNIASSAPIVACTRSGRNLVLKFAGSSVPPEVAFFKQSRPVRPRRSRPLQCTNCGKYGHVPATCTEQSRCLRCSDTHSTADCKAPKPKCINCGGRHIATEPRCPLWQQERKVAEIKAASPQPVTRREVMRVARNQPGRTYSQAFADLSAPPLVSRPHSAVNTDAQKYAVIAALAAAVKALLRTLPIESAVQHLCTAALAAHEALVQHG